VRGAIARTQQRLVACLGNPVAVTRARAIEVAVPIIAAVIGAGVLAPDAAVRGLACTDPSGLADTTFGAIRHALHLAVIPGVAWKAQARPVATHAVQGAGMRTPLEVASLAFPAHITFALCVHPSSKAFAVTAAAAWAVVLVTPIALPSLVTRANPREVVALALVLTERCAECTVGCRLVDAPGTGQFLAVGACILWLALTHPSGLQTSTSSQAIFEARSETAVGPSPPRVAHARSIILADAFLQAVRTGTLLCATVQTTPARQTTTDAILAHSLLTSSDAHSLTAIVPMPSIFALAFAQSHVALALAGMGAVSRA
jgi:hypothetical protein